MKATSRGKDDPGIIRIDFPGYSGEGKLTPIDWDEWFAKFDESNLALLVQDRTANGELSNFNKLVSRDSIEPRTPARRAPRTKRTAARTQRAGTRTHRPRATASKPATRARGSTGGRKRTSASRPRA